MRKIFLIIFLLIFLTTYVTANQGIWLTNSEIVALPTSGTAWTYVKSIADQSACTPALAIQADECNTRTLAQALVFVRLGDETYRQKVISELLVVADGNTEAGARSLALGREVGAYVISADLIDLPSYDPALNTRFRTKIRNLLTMYAPGGGVNSLTECAELRPNNWGNHCGATRVAIARYLGDEQILDRQAQVFKGYLGDRSSYAGFDYGELWWQCNQNLPVGLNPQGCTIQGHTVDGVMPDDQRRNSCVFQWPPCKEGYVWEGLQGSTVEAELLYRAGYDAWSWENQALKRALTWLHTPHFAGNTPYPADGNDDTGDDRWTPWLVNFAYGSGFTHIAAPQMGKNMAFTDWTHNRVRTQQTCAQQGGICCAAGNSCSGSSVPASDCSTTCCIGTCLPPDTVPPSVSITSPTNNQQVSGTITITATASDNVQVAGVQFKVDSNNIGSEDTSSPYAVSWNTATVSNGNHILTAVARDTSQNTATSQQINVNVQNIDSIPPDITNVQAVSITSNSASITWTTTNDPSDSQVEYGLTTSYGSQTTLNTNLVTSHSELITGLQASTLYHYRVKSRDSSNNLATSIDFTFTTINPPAGTVSVLPTVETAPVHHSGDSADDMLIWIHPTNPSLSTVIGDDKNGGILVWDLNGIELQYIEATSLMNNLDLRYNFPLLGTYVGGQSHTNVAIIGVNNENGNKINFYKVNPTSRLLEAIGSISLSTSQPYGSCMYHSPSSGKYYYFVNWKSGVIQQWELRDNGNGQIAGTMVRTFDVGSQVEGCVADDILADFYIGEETVGIWKYGAEPGDGSTRVQVDRTGAGGYLTADVEGLTLYYTSNNQGYLLASSQGNSIFVVYTRESNNAHIGSFRIVANGGIDAVSSTDGIDVTNFPLGTNFPEGLFVAHDGSNTGGNQNLKYVEWDAIADALGLVVDITWDPRLIGSTTGTCGNNIREGTEQCDMSDLGGQTCQTLGFGGGTLSCTAQCTFNTNLCTSLTCELTDASWSTSGPVVEGTQVSLNINGNNCPNGAQVNIEVREDDQIIGSNFNNADPTNIQIPNAIFNSGQATVIWDSEWIQDFGGIDADPEYIFRGTLVSDNSVFTDSTNELKVTQDTTPPEITNIQESPSTTTAAITWTTDDFSSSEVRYSTTQGVHTSVANGLDGTTHSVTLAGLQMDTIYYYIVSSTNERGYTSTSAEGSFTTLIAGVTEQNLKVAFIGDSDRTGNFQAVLDLINRENVDLVVHAGDLAYANDQTAITTWVNRISNTLGPNFPYIISVGNHDTSGWTDTGGSCLGPWTSYGQFIRCRVQAMNVVLDDPNTDDQKHALTYKGLKLIFTGDSASKAANECDPDNRNSANEYACFARDQLINDNSIWSVCAWHKQMATMTPGPKGNEYGWGPYEECRRYGAIIANAHSHTYGRTKTLTSMRNLVVDTVQHPLVNGVPSNPNNVLAALEKTFVFDSSLGGASVRNQAHCPPNTYPYGGGSGCNYAWASIYTSNSNPSATYGALFIEFYVDGNPFKARGYFKNINNQIIDQFEIISSAVGNPPTQVCGNNIREGTEQCDMSDLGGQTCQTLGFGGGTLSCTAQCTFDTNSCTVADTTPPVRSNGSPSGVLPSGTTTINLMLNTNEAATCKYSITPNIQYASMTNIFATTGGTQHSTQISGLIDDNTYNYYVRCQDNIGNANTNDFIITFSVGQPATSCRTTSTIWQNLPFTSETGIFSVEFDAIPNNANMDGVMGISNGPATGYNNLANIVRFNPLGNIDARNGGTYNADTTISYTPGISYHFRLVINIPTHTYSAYVAPLGSNEITIGSNYLFRTEQNAVADLNNFGLYSSVGSAQVCNFMTFGTDTNPPIISVTHNPLTNIQETTPVSITATASDENSVSSIEIFVDGLSKRICLSTTTCTYISTYLAGTHTYYATATDNSNNVGRDPTTGTKSFIVNAGDTTAPEITNVQAVSITSNSASIIWTTTNDPSDSQVEYGLTTSYGSQTTLNTNLVTSHSELITGLQASTLYHYRVKSRDSSNNLAISADFTFTTTNQAAVCGNNIREGTEQCDMSDLGGQTCQTLGFGGGTLSCTAQCTFDTNSCTGAIGPIIIWDSPTPADGATINQNSVSLATTITDNTNTAALFDWDNTLVGYWPIDSFTTSGINDKSTYDNFASFMGTLSTNGISNGVFGKAFTFGGSSDYLKIIDSNEFEGMNELTIAAWINPSSGLSDQRIVFKSNTYMLRLNSGKISFRIYNAGSSADVNTVATIPLNTWSHIVATFDGNSMKVYINGVQDSTTNTISGPVRNIVSSGGIAIGNNHAGGSAFNGLIDEVVILRRALSLEETKALYNNRVNRLSHSFIGLSERTYNYGAYAIDTDGNLNINRRSVIINFQQQCSTGPWQNQGCGQGGCTPTQTYQTRTVNPAGCDITSQCINDPTCTPTQICGNNIREGTEQCDMSDLGGQTCQSLGYTGGTLACTAQCTFNTNSCTVGDTTPPEITNVQAVSITSNSASIIWTTTNDPSDSQVEYGLTTSYGSQTTLNTNLVTSHSELITGLQASTLYHYRVKSRDSSNNLAISADFTFTTQVQQPGIEQVTYNLQRGLNFITVPLELSNNDILQVLSPILPEVDKVYTFYNGRWLIFRNKPNAPSSLNTIEPLRGYIVKMKNPGTFSLQGTIDNNRQLQLSSGWSLIGTNSLTSTPISTALQGLSYDSVWFYDTNTNTYNELNLNSGSLDSTKAYWVQLSNAGTFNP